MMDFRLFLCGIKLLPYQVYLLCLLLLSFELDAQTSAMKFDHLTVRDGLPNNTVTCTLQDQHGFLWFGTFKGLARYDGYSFLTYQYDANEPGSIQGNLISCIAEDQRGDLWVGSSNKGLSIYSQETGLFEPLASGRHDTLLIPHFSIRVIFKDSRDYMWIGTEDGLSIITPDRKLYSKYYFDSQRAHQPLNGPVIYDIAESSDGRIWIATDHQNLCVYDPKLSTFSTVRYTHLQLTDKDDNVLKNLHFHQDSMLYVGSNNGGLSRLNIQTNQFKTFLPDPHGLSSMQVRDIISVGDQLWLATDGHGIDRFDPVTGRFTNHQKSRLDQHSISSNAIWSLYPDRQGIVWACTYEGGLNKYDPQHNTFQLMDNNPCDPQSLPNQPVLSIFEGNKNEIWVGTDWGGLSKMSPDGSTVHFSDTSGLSTNVVKSLEADRHGNLLIGTYNFGLTRYLQEKGAFQHYKRELNKYQALPSNNVWCIYTDSRGISWLGTLGGGIATFDPDTESFEVPGIDYSNGGQHHVYQIMEDAQSNLWFSTDAGVLYYHRRLGEWSELVLSEELHSDNHQLDQVRAVVEDNLRHLWFATAAGLVHYLPESETYTWFGTAAGFPELPLLNLTMDGYGNLLVISKTHVTQFDLSRHTTTSFQVTDNSFNAGALLKSSSGQVLLGGTHGITTFDPALLRKNNYTPPVYITGFQPVDQSLAADEQPSTSAIHQDLIEIGPNESVINFQYTALNYIEPARNQFAYRLEGFDEDWQYVGSRRFASYTNLDHGTYTFLVKGSNNHGVWNDEGTSIQLVIHPPFWKTIWFKALLTISGILLVYSIQRARISQLRRSYENQQLKSDQELIRMKNKNLHQELESTKSEMNIVTMSYLHKNQKLQQIRQKVKETASKISADEAGRIHRLVREIDNELQNEDYWDEFEHQFNKSHDNFLERFKIAYPDLSKRELRICAYLRMGLDNHEIAILMNVTVRTIEQSRYRIRKKINLETRQSFTKMILRF